jgi:hypothetical protein
VSDQTRTPPITAVPLSQFEGTVTVAEQIALTDATVRAHVSYAVAGAFVATNLLTAIGVAYIFIQDNANLVASLITTSDRVITPNVVMTIIGATTIQLGALALTMGKYLYPGSSKPTRQKRTSLSS